MELAAHLTARPPPARSEPPAARLGLGADRVIAAGQKAVAELQVGRIGLVAVGSERSPVALLELAGPGEPPVVPHASRGLRPASGRRNARIGRRDRAEFTSARSNSTDHGARNDRSTSVRRKKPRSAKEAAHAAGSLTLTCVGSSKSAGVEDTGGSGRWQRTSSQSRVQRRRVSICSSTSIHVIRSQEPSMSRQTRPRDARDDIGVGRVDCKLATHRCHMHQRPARKAPERAARGRSRRPGPSWDW